MLNLVKEYLKKQEWQYSQIENKDIFLFSIGGEKGNFQCIIDISESEHRLKFFTISSANAPIEKRNEILELLNKLNFGFFIGNFEMDPDNGQIRYKTNLSYQFIEEPNILLLEELIMMNIITMDRCTPSILGVLYGNLSVDKAIELLEDTEDKLEE